MISLKKILNKILVDLKNTFKKSDIIPVKNGGTGATTAAAARANLGLTGAETKTLLWTNASPTSNFSAQTISLDLSGYDAVLVCAASGGNILSVLIYKGSTTKVTCMMTGFIWISGQGDMLAVRGVDVYDDRIYVDYGFARGVGNSTAIYNSDSILIPQKIYGVKGV